VLLDGVRQMLVEESQRGESLNTRGAAVSGFLGIVIALSGTVEGTTFTSGGTYHAVAASLAAAALVSLLVSVGLIGWGVLLPSAADAISIDDVEKFPTYRFITQTPLMVTGYLLTGSVGVLKRERNRNNRKARWLRFGYVAMSIGLLLVSGAGFALTVKAVLNA
jgi:hypothetical protein